MQLDMFAVDSVAPVQPVMFLADCSQFEDQIALENDCSITKCALIHFCQREFCLSDKAWNSLSDERRGKYLQMSLDLLTAIAKALPPKLCS